MRRSALLCCLLAFPSFLGAQDRDEGERLVWKAFDPRFTKQFFQEVTTDVKQTLKVMGADLSQTQHQSFLYRYEPQMKDRRQNWVVEQEIVRVRMALDLGGTRIDVATDRPKNTEPLGELLKALEKAKLRFTIGPRLDVKEVVGHEALAKKLAGATPTSRPLLETLLSKEAVGQLMEMSVAPFPTVLVTKGTSWTRDSELKLGGIGSYKFRNRFTYEGKEGALDRIGIVGHVEIIVGQPSPEMPFKITKADFKESTLRGFALFDRAKGRLERMETTMDMTGTLAINIGGTDTTIDLRQRQEMKSRTTDGPP